MSSDSPSPDLPEKQVLLRRLRVLELRQAAREHRDDHPAAMPEDEVLELMNQKYQAMGIADPDK
jgi:hypothetical protein